MISSSELLIMKLKPRDEEEDDEDDSSSMGILLLTMKFTITNDLCKIITITQQDKERKHI